MLRDVISIMSNRAKKSVMVNITSSVNCLLCNAITTTLLYTLSLHDALPIFGARIVHEGRDRLTSGEGYDTTCRAEHPPEYAFIWPTVFHEKIQFPISVEVDDR